MFRHKIHLYFIPFSRSLSSFNSFISFAFKTIPNKEIYDESLLMLMDDS